MARASPYARHTPQNTLPGKVNVANPDASKKTRLVWDGTTKANWYEIPMHEVTPTEEEADITFGYVYMAFLFGLSIIVFLFQTKTYFGLHRYF